MMLDKTIQNKQQINISHKVMKKIQCEQAVNIHKAINILTDNVYKYIPSNTIFFKKMMILIKILKEYVPDTKYQYDNLIFDLGRITGVIFSLESKDMSINNNLSTLNEIAKKYGVRND